MKVKPTTCNSCDFYYDNPDWGCYNCRVNGQDHYDLYGGETDHRPKSCPLDMTEKDFIKLNINNQLDITDSFDYFSKPNKIISKLSKAKVKDSVDYGSWLDF